MKHPYTGLDDGTWIPDAVDLQWGSEAGCVVLLALWLATNLRRESRYRALVCSTLAVATTFELVATRVLMILIHNPGYCEYWIFPTIPTAVIASWSVGIMAHMALSNRISGLTPAGRAAADVCLLLLMDVMTEVGGVAHNCWAWPPQQDFVDMQKLVGAPTPGATFLGDEYRAFHALAPSLLAERWWGVAAANYTLVPGTVLLHSLFMRKLLPDGIDARHAKGMHWAAVAAVSVVVLPVLVLCWVVMSAQLVAAVGHVASTALVLVPCALAVAVDAFNAWRSGRLGFCGSPDVATVCTLAGCYALNTSRLVTMPGWTAAQLVMQLGCISVAMGVALWPSNAKQRVE